MEKHGQGDVTLAEVEATRLKSSAWSEEEREKPSTPAPVEAKRPTVEVPLPQPGTIFPLAGFMWRVVAVDPQVPRLAVLLEPVGPTKALRKIIAKDAEILDDSE